MNVDWVRAHCLALPHTTEQILWGDDLVFKIGGKMYAVAVLAPHKSRHVVQVHAGSIRGTGGTARNHPGALFGPQPLGGAGAGRRAAPRRDQTPDPRSYELVFAKLPKKTQAELSEAGEYSPQSAEISRYCL